MQELLFIGVIALIILGPRKLPQLARTIGKWTTELRRTTNEFKETWEREVNFEEFKEEGNIKTIAPNEKSIAKNGRPATEKTAALPEIREIEPVAFEQNLPVEIKTEVEIKTVEELNVTETTGEKQNWL